MEILSTPNVAFFVVVGWMFVRFRYEVDDAVSPEDDTRYHVLAVVSKPRRHRDHNDTETQYDGSFHAVQGREFALESKQKRP